MVDVPGARTGPVEEVLEPSLRICDPHFHIMDSPRFKYSLSDYLRDTTSGHLVTSTVYVETTSYMRQTGPEHLRPLGEVDFVCARVREAGDIPVRIAAGIVGFVDLTKGGVVGEALDAAIEAGGGALKGIRHDQTWDDTGTLNTRYADLGPTTYSRPDFRAGIAELNRRGLSLDTWQYFYQLPVLADLARDFPDTRININHVGGVVGIGPFQSQRDEIFATWRGHMRDLARLPNVTVKLGGLGMPMSGLGFDKRATPASSEELAAAWKPYIEACIEAFGPARCMFESNFPVDGQSCSYLALWNAFKRIAAGASADEKALLFHDTARNFYRL